MSRDEFSLRRDVEAGLEAQAVLENKTFEEITKEILKDFQDKFIGEDHRKAWEARRQVLVFNEIIGKLRFKVGRGQEAQKQLNNMRDTENSERAVI